MHTKKNLLWVCIYYFLYLSMYPTPVNTGVYLIFKKDKTKRKQPATCRQGGWRGKWRGSGWRWTGTGWRRSCRTAPGCRTRYRTTTGPVRTWGRCVTVRWAARCSADVRHLFNQNFDAVSIWYSSACFLYIQDTQMFRLISTTLTVFWWRHYRFEKTTAG